MTSDEKTLNLFTTRLRELILHYQELKARCANIQKQLEHEEEKNRAITERLNQAENDYANLKTARMVTIADGDIDAAKDKIAKLIRDIDKCITLLNE